MAYLTEFFLSIPFKAVLEEEPIILLVLLPID